MIPPGSSLHFTGSPALTERSNLLIGEVTVEGILASPGLANMALEALPFFLSHSCCLAKNG